MICRSSAWWLIAWLLANAGLAWGETDPMAPPAGNTPAAVGLAAPAPQLLIESHGTTGEAFGSKAPIRVQGAGNSLGAQGKAVYEENHWLEDFEVHFVVSLPFTALYSYVAVSAVDSTVQGKFPTTFAPADMWVVLGLALGSSLAVALGSVNRVPDQSVPRMAREPELDFSAQGEPPLEVALVQIDF